LWNDYLGVMIGQTIANYEIKSLLGEGGMGTVYLAEHTKLGRRVAIKVLLPHLLKNEIVRERFMNEAKLMSSLQHPNIVTLFDYIEDALGLSLIMEYVQGQPLDDYILQVSGPIPEKDAVSLFDQVLAGFSYAHKMGLVHRDIKPSNFIITLDKKIKILDFGIAKLVGQSGNKLTKTGSHIGTVYYMSPEQVRGYELDLRSDIYALGVTFFQMLTGTCPYEGLTTEFDVFNKIVGEELPDPRTIYPGISDHMCFVIQKATAKNLEDRFQTCDEFAQALENKEFIVEPSLVAPILETEKGANEGVQESPNLVPNERLEPQVSKEVAGNSNEIPEVAPVQPTKEIPEKRKRLLGYLVLGSAALILVLLFIYLRSPKNNSNQNVGTNNSETVSDQHKTDNSSSEADTHPGNNKNKRAENSRKGNSNKADNSFETQDTYPEIEENQGPTQEEIDEKIANEERRNPLKYISFHHDGGRKTILDNIKINVEISNHAEKISYANFTVEITYFDKHGGYKGTDSQVISTIINPGYRLSQELKFVPPFGVREIDLRLVGADAAN